MTNEKNRQWLNAIEFVCEHDDEELDDQTRQNLKLISSNGKQPISLIWQQRTWVRKTLSPLLEVQQCSSLISALITKRYQLLSIVDEARTSLDRKNAKVAYMQQILKEAEERLKEEQSTFQRLLKPIFDFISHSYCQSYSIYASPYPSTLRTKPSPAASIESLVLSLAPLYLGAIDSDLKKEIKQMAVG